MMAGLALLAFALGVVLCTAGVWAWTPFLLVWLIVVVGGGLAVWWFA